MCSGWAYCNDLHASVSSPSSSCRLWVSRWTSRLHIEWSDPSKTVNKSFRPLFGIHMSYSLQHWGLPVLDATTWIDVILDAMTAEPELRLNQCSLFSWPDPTYVQAEAPRLSIQLRLTQRLSSTHFVRCDSTVQWSNLAASSAYIIISAMAKHSLKNTTGGGGYLESNDRNWLRVEGGGRPWRSLVQVGRDAESRSTITDTVIDSTCRCSRDDDLKQLRLATPFVTASKHIHEWVI